MTVTIYNFPTAWYEFIVGQKYPLRSLNMAANRPWSSAGQAINGTHTQMFVTDVTMAPNRDPDLQDMDALFTRLRGRSNALRIADSLRLAPWYDRSIDPEVATWSDSSLFTDGSGFANGFLPPEVYVYSAAAKGSNYIVLGGFPVSITAVLRAGDPFEIKPSGVPAEFPHRYKAMFSSSSDASGRLGVSIEPRLRAGVAAGDPVSLRYASSVFRLADDTQADISGTGGGVGNFGFSLVEALDLIP